MPLAATTGASTSGTIMIPPSLSTQRTTVCGVIPYFRETELEIRSWEERAIVKRIRRRVETRSHWGYRADRLMMLRGFRLRGLWAYPDAYGRQSPIVAAVTVDHPGLCSVTGTFALAPLSP